jgi:hypothetical protein
MVQQLGRRISSALAICGRSYWHYGLRYPSLDLGVCWQKQYLHVGYGSFVSGIQHLPPTYCPSWHDTGHRTLRRIHRAVRGVWYVEEILFIFGYILTNRRRMGDVRKRVYSGLALAWCSGKIPDLIYEISSLADLMQATITMSLLLLLSVSWLRIKCYEIFLIFHIAFSVITLLGCFL